MICNRFDVARMTLQTLINTYPDSEFIARAKLAEGDSWYAEGGTASLAQAEQDYRDFQTFFPNMPEAAEAQLKIANIQYQQMEKADRDFTHAKRAEEEYRTLMMQYPDTAKMVAEGKERLLEVQEVLAEREFEIGRFYFLRTSYPASIARLQSLMEKYPIYSKADEALYLLGQDYEGEIARVRAAPTCTAPGKPPGCATEAMKSQLIEGPTKSAAEAYSKIITRYPIMDRVDDAKRRLAALLQPIPRPTKAAVAQNKAEDASRHEATMFGKLMGVVRKGPDVAQATKIGEPSPSDPTPVAAIDVTHKQLQALMAPAGAEKGVSVEKVDASGMPAANEPAPRSDAPAPAGGSPFAQPTAPAADPNELTPTTAAPPANTAPDPNELKPNADAAAALPPPPQVNEIQQGQAGGQATASSSSSSSATTASDANAEASDKDLSTSKKKKKKGLKKI